MLVSDLVDRLTLQDVPNPVRVFAWAWSTFVEGDAECYR